MINYGVDTKLGGAVSESVRIGAVVLTYNSVDDLRWSLDGLILQRSIETLIIVVDNASSKTNLAAMEEIFLEKLPDGIIVSAADATPSLLNTSHALFVRSPKNYGYSAGNNIGARLAVASGCEAVLILNPDIRISDRYYLAELWAGMQSAPNCMVASSRVVNLMGRDEHPLREAKFLEELLWFRPLIPKKFRPTSLVIPPTGTAPIEAEKLHGSCLLLRSSFLNAINFLDEKVFLYCEEAILATEVRRQGGQMMVFPKLEAVHAHIAETKGNPSKRMLLFIASRLYYLETYGKYGPVKIRVLRASYAILSLLHRLKVWVGRP